MNDKGTDSTKGDLYVYRVGSERGPEMSCGGRVTDGIGFTVRNGGGF